MWLNIYFLIGICYMIANCYMHNDYTRQTTKEYFEKKNWKCYYNTPKDLLVFVCVLFWVTLWPLAIGYQSYRDIRFWLNIKD